MAKVLVWQSQLAANDFPPVCAMTGKQAETWRKFSFSSAPPFAFWIGGLLLASIMARRAGGHLPLTRDSVKRIRMVTFGVVGLLVLALVFFILAVIVGSAAGNDPVGSTFAALFVVLGIGSVIVFLIALVVVRRTYGPTGKVLEQQPGQYESLIELNNVHPAFVAAVQQLQQARAAQFQPQPKAYPPFESNPPGSYAT